MKHLFLSAICLFGIAVYGKSQQNDNASAGAKTVLENDKLKVVEYISAPGKDACGKGMHSHPPHLTIFLTDAVIKLTTPDGKSQNFDFKSGFTLWSEADTHAAINNGNKPIKVYLLEMK